MDIILFFEWFTFCCSLVILHPANDPRLRKLILITAITVIAETLGYYLRTTGHPTNHPVYNISVPLIIILFILIFREQLRTNKKRLTASVALGMYAAFVLCDLTLIQGSRKFATYNYIFGTLILLIIVSLYYLELIRSDKYVFVSREPVFWLAAAVLLLYIPKSILYAAFEYFVYRRTISAAFGRTFLLLNVILSIIFFCLLSYASICRLIFRK